MALNKISIISVVVALAFLVSVCAAASGSNRRLAQSTAQASATFTTTGGSGAAVSTAKSSKGSTAVSEVKGTASGGANVKVKGEAKANKGKSARTKVAAKGEDEADLDVSVSTETKDESDADAPVATKEKDGADVDAPVATEIEDETDSDVPVATETEDETDPDVPVATETEDETDSDVPVVTETTDETSFDLAEAEQKAVAVLAQIQSSGNDREFQIAAVTDLVRRGEGAELAILVEDAYAIDQTLGVLINDAIARAMNDVRLEDVAAVARTIVNGTAVGGDRSRLFTFSIMNLVRIAGCDDVRGVLIEADQLAAAEDKYVERAFIEALNIDVELIECAYQTCTGKRKQCCNERDRAAGFCNCDGKFCDYRLFWQIPQPIWACSFENEGCDRPKCMCAPSDDAELF